MSTLHKPLNSLDDIHEGGHTMTATLERAQTMLHAIHILLPHIPTPADLIYGPPAYPLDHAGGGDTDPGRLPHRLDTVTDDWETGHIRTADGIRELLWDVADEWADNLNIRPPHHHHPNLTGWMWDVAPQAHERTDPDTWTASAETIRTARMIGLDEHEIRATLNSAWRAGSTQPRHVDELTAPDTVILQPVPNQDPPLTAVTAPGPTPTPARDIADSDEERVREPETIEEAVHQHLPIINWHDLWEQEDDEDWILEPLIAKRRGIVIYSPPKVGKSLFSLEMAVHISRGDHWLGTTIDAPHNVLYVDFENDPRGDTRSRLQAMGYGPDDLANLKMLSFPTLPGLDTKHGAQQLLAACHVYQCDVVIIDTISRAVDGDENENDTWLAFYRHTGLLLKQNEITMVRLDHTGKDESKGQRGGSAKSGDVDAIWKLSKVTEDGSKLQLKLDDARMQITERTLILDRIPDPLHHKVAGSGQMAAWDAKVAEIMNALDDHEIPLDVGRNKARDLIKGLGLTASNDVLSEAIRLRKNRPYSLPSIEVGGPDAD